MQYKVPPMPITFRFPRTYAEQGLKFPSRCLSCGAPKEAESTLTLHRLVARGQSQVEVAVKLPIPHCARCARTTQNVFLAGCVPFVFGFGVLGFSAFGAVFLGVSWLGLDAAPLQPDTPLPSWVLGGLAGLLAGFIGGFLCEVLARFLLFPVFGQALLRAPLLAMQLLRDSDYVAGVAGTLSPDAVDVQLKVLNPTLAHEFEQLNTPVLSKD